MIITVCDNCREEKELFYDEDNKQYCEHCYYYSSLYTKTQLEEDHGIKLGRELSKYGAFCYIFPDQSTKDVAEELTEGLKKFGITAHPIDHDDAFVIGFSLDENLYIGSRSK